MPESLWVFRSLRIAVLAIACLAGSASFAAAQEWKVAVYPVLAWLPRGIDIGVDVPPFDGGGGSGGEVDIIDGRFDGAFLGGISAEKDRFRVDVDFMWAAVGGDRVDRPQLTVDADLIYGHGTVGFKVAPELFVTGGVRRLALDYDIRINDQPNFHREPGFWNPLIGLGWHRVGEKIEWHGVVEGGGFGVGSDVDFGAGLRIDWKPIAHFGLTGGYNFLYFKGSNELANRTFTVKQTMHGPSVGIGIYF